MNDPMAGLRAARVGSRRGRAVSAWFSRRRVFTLGAAGAAGAALPLVRGSSVAAAPASPDSGWGIGGPNRIFDVTHFGARGDGVTIDSDAINRAIEAAAAGPRPGGT